MATPPALRRQLSPPCCLELQLLPLAVLIKRREIDRSGAKIYPIYPGYHYHKKENTPQTSCSFICGTTVRKRRRIVLHTSATKAHHTAGVQTFQKSTRRRRNAIHAPRDVINYSGKSSQRDEPRAQTSQSRTEIVARIVSACLRRCRGCRLNCRLSWETTTTAKNNKQKTKKSRETECADCRRGANKVITREKVPLQ